MFDPTAFPYARAQTYTDGVAPAVLSDVFYNPVQDALARVFGGLTGISTSIASEDFAQLRATGSGVGDPFGEQMRVTTATNCGAASGTGSGVGDFGVWRIAVTANGNFAFEASDAPCFVGARDFLYVAKLKVQARVRLNSVANRGLVVGLETGLTGYPVFVAGSDQANWHASAAGLGTVNTGVPLLDNTWYWVMIAGRSGTAYWYVFQNGVGAAVVNAAMAPLGNNVARSLRVSDGTGSALAGDFVDIDLFARGIAR